MPEKRKGLFRSTFAVLGNSVKGALGGEFLAGGANLATSAKYTLKAKTCPRCFERSLFEQEGGGFFCDRHDICGWIGTADDIDALNAMGHNISPVVYAVAKGVRVNVDKACQVNTLFSWVLWFIVLGIVLYSLYLSLFGSLFMSFWVLMVAFLFSLHAIRFAYRVQYMKGVFMAQPRDFLLYPRLWFVV